MLIEGMYGFGDNIYQRGFVRHFPGSHIRTPFPELYSDLDVKCVRPITSLRTQSKNIRLSGYAWHNPPRNAEVIKVAYGHNELRRGSIIDAMRKVFKVEPIFDLPDTGAWTGGTSKPIAVVRPVTLRNEWLNTARAPLPEYIDIASKILHEKGFHVISIADVDERNEWLHGETPYADQCFHKGELSFTALLSLVKSAAVVVGGVGWITPACIAAGTPGFFILGGNGAHNAPEKVTDPAVMKLSKIGWARPDNFCMCHNKQHNCDKRIGGFHGKFSNWIDKEILGE
jgi:hypothetical protein